VYLSESLKRDLERLASEEGISEAELIRDAIRARVERPRRRAPRLPLLDRPLGDASVSGLRTMLRDLR
jgi:hypothetical protein